MQNNEQKLYKVTLKGMTFSSTGSCYGVSYVIAEDSHKAYMKVKKFLDDNNLGFTKDRELKTVELIASSYQYNNIGFILHI